MQNKLVTADWFDVVSVDKGLIQINVIKLHRYSILVTHTYTFVLPYVAEMSKDKLRMMIDGGEISENVAYMSVFPDNDMKLEELRKSLGALSRDEFDRIMDKRTSNRSKRTEQKVDITPVACKVASIAFTENKITGGFDIAWANIGLLQGKSNPIVKTSHILNAENFKNFLCCAVGVKLLGNNDTRAIIASLMENCGVRHKLTGEVPSDKCLEIAANGAKYHITTGRLNKKNEEVIMGLVSGLDETQKKHMNMAVLAVRNNKSAVM